MDRNIERPIDRPIERLIDFHINEGIYSYPDTPIASIPTGAVVFDTTDGVVKKCRWVYKPISNYLGLVLSLPLVPDLSADWAFKILFKDLEPALSSTDNVFYFKRTSTQVRLLQITRKANDTFSFYLKNANDTFVGVSTPTLNACVSNEWNTIELSHSGNIVSLKLNDGAPVVVSYTDWDTTNYAESAFYAWGTNQLPAYLAQFNQVCDGVICDDIPLDESEGLIARNIANPSRTGLYNQNSHAKALVPLSLLS